MSAPHSAQSGSFQIHALDVGYLELPGAANAFLIEGPGGFALIECGTAATWPALQQKLSQRGVRPEQVADVLLTHIHLDHAGAAGHLAARGARIWVHPFGRRHLIDPGKLLASSRRVHGAMYERSYGDLLPVPESQALAVDDGQTISAAGLSFRAIETAGHARHHHAWLLELDRDRHLFCGDILGIVVPGGDFNSIPTPPPEFDPAAWRASLRRVRGAGPTHLWLTHGGLQSKSAAEAAQFCDRMEARLNEECEILQRLAGRIIVDGEPESPQRETALLRAIAEYRSWLQPKARQAGVADRQFGQFLGDYFLRMNLNGAVRLASTIA